MKTKNEKVLPRQETWKYGRFHIDVFRPDYREECMRVAREAHRKWQAVVEGVSRRLGLSTNFFPGLWRKRSKTGLTWAQVCRRATYIVDKITHCICWNIVCFDPKTDMVAYWLMEKPTSEVFAAFKSVCESLGFEGFEDIDWTDPNWADVDAKD